LRHYSTGNARQKYLYTGEGRHDVKFAINEKYIKRLRKRVSIVKLNNILISGPTAVIRLLSEKLQCV
jgi:hypothetical protein